MNEIGKQLAQEGLDFLKASKTFVSEQAPEFISQVLKWEQTSATIGLSSGFLVMGACILAARYGFSIYRPESMGNDVAALCVVFGSLIGVIAFAVVIGNAMTLLKIKTAPKVYLMEYFAGLIE